MRKAARSLIDFVVLRLAAALPAKGLMNDGEAGSEIPLGEVGERESVGRSISEGFILGENGGATPKRAAVAGEFSGDLA